MSFVRTIRTLAVLTLAVLAVACGGSSPSSSPTDPAASPTTATRAGTLTGTLEGDAQLEGGCVWIVPTGGEDADLAEQVMPLFPDGYAVEFEPDLQVLGPDGEVVATRGQELVLDGAPAEAMATSCQVGPPYRVDEVLGTIGS